MPASTTEGQDEYLQPNTNPRPDEEVLNQNEPLVHIWETPLPQPGGTGATEQSAHCTIHRIPKDSRVPNGPNVKTATNDIIRSGTSYYSPNTGHKYYVVDKST